VIARAQGAVLEFGPAQTTDEKTPERVNNHDGGITSVFMYHGLDRAFGSKDRTD